MGETMRKILAGLFFACLILPTQVYSKCLNLSPNDHCKKYAVDGLDSWGGCNWESVERWHDEEEKEIEYRNIIYNNCYVSMLSEKEPDRDYKLAVEEKCERISENPSFWDKIKYSD